MARMNFCWNLFFCGKNAAKFSKDAKAGLLTKKAIKNLKVILYNPLA